METVKAHQLLGYAKAATEACPKLAINPEGVLAIMKGLNAADQADVAGSGVMTEHYKSESAKIFAMLGDGACVAALGYEKKLGIDIFMEAK